MTTVINDVVFEGSGKVPPNVFTEQLHIRGAGPQIDRALEKIGWNGTDPVIVPILSVSPGEAKIIGSRFATRGLLGSATMKATSVWPGAVKDAQLSWELTGNDFEWDARGDPSIPANFSRWADAREKNLIKISGPAGGDIRWEDVLPGGDPGISLRLEVHPATRNTALLYLTFVPLSLADLLKKCEAWETEAHGDRVPSALWMMGPAPNAKYGAIQVTIFWQEPSDMDWGFGAVPLIEQVKNGKMENKKKSARE